VTRSRAALAALAVVGVVGVVLVLGLRVAADPKPGWTLVVPERVELAPGVSGTITLDIVPGTGRTISRDGPIRLDVTPPDGVTIARRRLSLADATDPGAASPRFAIKLGADHAGSYPVAIAIRLWLCDRQTCKPVTATRTVTVDVAAPAPPDAAPPPPDAVKIDARPKRKPRVTP
jgi:hypothetical protein